MSIRTARFFGPRSPPTMLLLGGQDAKSPTSWPGSPFPSGPEGCHIAIDPEQNGFRKKLLSQSHEAASTFIM